MLFSFMKSESGEEAEEEKSEASIVLFMRFKERSHFHDIELQSKAAIAGVEAAASWSRRAS